jgi:hypothetical protein
MEKVIKRELQNGIRGQLCYSINIVSPETMYLSIETKESEFTVFLNREAAKQLSRDLLIKAIGSEEQNDAN